MVELDERLGELERLKPSGVVIVSGKSGFIAGADITEFREARHPGRGRAFGASSARRDAATRGPALPDGGGHQRLLPRRRARTRARLPAPGLRRRSEGHAGAARGPARHQPGIRRHRAQRAARGRRRRDGHDADGHELSSRQGTAGRPRRRSRAGRATPPRRQAARAAAAAPAPGAARPAPARPACRARHGRRPDRTTGRAPGATRALPGAVRDRGPVAPAWRESTHGLRGGGAVRCQARVHADFAQPRARVLPAGAAQGPRRQRRAEGRPRARGRRGGHGRRHRGLVRSARLHRDAAGPRTGVRATRARPCEGLFREAREGARQGRGEHGAAAGGHRGPAALPAPTW